MGHCAARGNIWLCPRLSFNWGTKYHLLLLFFVIDALYLRDKWFFLCTIYFYAVFSRFTFQTESCNLTRIIVWLYFNILNILSVIIYLRWNLELWRFWIRCFLTLLAFNSNFQYRSFLVLIHCLNLNLTRLAWSIFCFIFIVGWWHYSLVFVLLIVDWFRVLPSLFLNLFSLIKKSLLVKAFLQILNLWNVTCGYEFFKWMQVQVCDLWLPTCMVVYFANFEPGHLWPY